VSDPAEKGAAPRPAAAEGVGERLRRRLIALVASARVRDRLARFPLTRAVARHQAQGLFDLCAGFVYSQVLAAFVDLNLHTHLADGPLTVAEAGARADLPPAAAERLLRAAASLGLASLRPDGRFALGLKGAALIENPGVVAMIRHHAAVYRDLSDPVALLQGRAGETETQRFWAYLAPSSGSGMAADSVNEYSDLMAVSQTMVAEIVTASFDFRPYRRICDIGGGLGVFAEHVARRAAAAELIVFDLPQVAEAAARRLAEVGLGGRVRTQGGSFRDDALPADCDLMTMVRVAFDHDDDTVLTILTAARAALKPGGALLIAEPFGSDRADRRTADAYFGFYLLAMGSGRIRTADEHAALLNRAGFKTCRALTTVQPGLVRLMLAET
jgi:demethylspheroidene O-methyltransferase